MADEKSTDDISETEVSRHGRRRLLLTVVISVVVVLAISAVVIFVVTGSGKNPSEDPNSGHSDDAETEGTPDDVLPDGIKVVDRGMLSGGVGPEGENIYSAGAVFENTSKHAIAIRVTYTIGDKQKSGEPSRKVTFPSKSSSPTYVTVLPGKQTGAGEYFEKEDSPLRGGGDYLQIRATANKVETEDGNQYEGLAKTTLDYPDDGMVAEPVKISSDGGVEFEVTNNYPVAVTGAEIGVVYKAKGAIKGGWISMSDDCAGEGCCSGVENGAKEKYKPGKSRHTLQCLKGYEIDDPSDLQIFIWP